VRSATRPLKPSPRSRQSGPMLVTESVYETPPPAVGIVGDAPRLCRTCIVHAKRSLPRPALVRAASRTAASRHKQSQRPADRTLLRTRSWRVRRDMDACASDEGRSSPRRVADSCFAGRELKPPRAGRGMRRELGAHQHRALAQPRTPTVGVRGVHAEPAALVAVNELLLAWPCDAPGRPRFGSSRSPARAA
jgi:hypothetical protein